MEKPIIDISEFNSVTDWFKVKDHVAGVIIRLGYRGYGQSGKIVFDKKYASHMNACRSQGIPFGIYFFPQAITKEEAEDEADFILDAIRGLKLSFPVYLDSELAEVHGLGRADNLNPVERTNLLGVIINVLRNNGINCGVYASTNWLQTRLVPSLLSDNTPIWCAQYASACTYQGDYDIWQYTSKGIVPGIAGNVDLNKLVREVAELPKKKFEPYAARVNVKTLLNVRKEPKATGELLFTLPNNMVISIMEEKNGWGRIMDIEGWVYLRHVKKG